jgi:hypothetical protein
MSDRPKLTNSVDIEKMLAHLKLETVDATQTAFANSGIHISEATAIKWRELARDDMASKLPELLYDDEGDVGRNPVCGDAPIQMGCCKRMATKLCQLLCMRTKTSSPFA